MRSLEPKALRRLLAASALAVAALTAACGGDDDDDDNGTGPDDETAIEVTNSSDREVIFLFIWDCGTDDIGDDQLGPETTLPPGESFTQEVTAGCYNVGAVAGTQEEPFEALYEDQEVEEGETQRITIEDEDWEAASIAARAPLGVGRK
jgi:hypothetical protein